MDHGQAIAWVDDEIAGLPETATWRLRRSELLGLRSVLQVGQSCQRVIDQLAPLCPCSLNPESYEGPQQECPVHGDGEMFVALCRWRDAVVAAVHAYNDAYGARLLDEHGPSSDMWLRVCELLDDGPWAPPAAQVVGAAAELEIEGRGPHGSANPGRMGWF